MSRTDPDPALGGGVQEPRLHPGKAMRWKLALLVVALNGVLFVKGCRGTEGQHRLIVTLGFFLPFATLDVEEVRLGSNPDPPELLLPTRGEFSVPLLFLNLALTVGALWWLGRTRPALARRLGSRSFLGATIFSFALFNSFMAHAFLWVHLVFFPTAYTSAGAAWLLFLGNPPEQAIDPRHATTIAARVYYLAFVGCSYALVLLAGRLVGRAGRKTRIDGKLRI